MPNWKKLITSGSDANLNSLNLSSVVNAGEDTDKFLVLDSSGNIDFRTGDNVLSDIGAQGSGNYVVDAGGAAGQVGVWSSATDMSGSNSLFFETSNNRLGIGTNSPSEKLTVEGNISASGALQLDATIPIKLLVNGGASNDSTEFRNGGGEFKIYSGRTTNAKHQSFIFSTGDNYTSGATRMVITGSNGNVGIGTTSPDELFDVAGTARFETGIAEGTIYVGNDIQHWGDGGTGIYFDTDEVQIQTDSGTRRATIDAAGLDVVGSITASGNISSSGTGSFNSIALPGTTTNYYIGGSGGGEATNALRIGSHTTSNSVALEIFHSSNPVSLGIDYDGGAGLAFIESAHGSYDVNTHMLFKPGGSETWRIGSHGSDASNKFEIKPAAAGNDFVVADNTGASILSIDTSTKQTTFAGAITASGNISGSQFFGTHFSSGNNTDNSLDLATNNTMQFRVGGASRITHTSTIFRPTTDEAVSLGRPAQKWKELVVNHITASGNLLIGDNHFIGDDSFDNLHILASSGENVVIQAPSGNSIDLKTAGGSTLNLDSSQNATFAGHITGSGKLLVSHSDSSDAYLLRLHQENNGSGVGIEFSDNSAGTQRGFLLHRHSDSESYGGGASFHFRSTEDDLVLAVGNADSTHGRMVVWSAGNDAEADYGFAQDVNTGMVRTSADNVSLVAGGVRGIGVGTTAVSLKYAGNTKLATATDGIDITGNLTITGTLTAEQYVTTTVSSSVIYQSGSTQFGDTLDDTHTFTGSLNVSGSAAFDIGGRELKINSISGYPRIQADNNLFLDGGSLIQLATNTIPSADSSIKLGQSNRFFSELYVDETFIGNDISHTHNITGSIGLSGSLDLEDNVKARFGDGGDLEFYHNGTNSNIQNFTGNLTIRNDQNDGDIELACDDGSGGVTPYLTLDGGAAITLVSREMRFTDNVPMKLGTGPDFQMLHNGTTTSFENSTGNLLITNFADDSDIIFKSDDGSGGATEYFRLDGGTEQNVFSKDILITNALVSNQENTDVDTGTETVSTVAHASYDAAFFDFVIKSGTNLRAGTVFATHDGTNVEFTETSTNDLGDTSDVTLSVDISGADLRLRATTTSDNWTVKSLVRGL